MEMNPQNISSMSTEDDLKMIDVEQLAQKFSHKSDIMRVLKVNVSKFLNLFAILTINCYS